MSDDSVPRLEFPAPRLKPEVRTEQRGSIAEPGEPPEQDQEQEPTRGWQLNALLFGATVLSAFLAGAAYANDNLLSAGGFLDALRFLSTGWTFAVPLLSILLVHEFGHYFAARLHRVDASLPYFLPLPVLSPFGTVGAIIAMRGRIRSRNALLDIGASGPLAGLVVAIPVLAYGLSLSAVGPAKTGHYTMEGQSLLYLALKHVVLGPLPPGYDVNLHPTAFAGWAGLLVTMLNLLPWGQLDGGHVAFALLGRTHNAVARVFRAALLPLWLYNAGKFLMPVALGRSDMGLLQAFFNSVFWLVWFVALGVIATMSGGAEHPETEPGELSPVRRVVAIVTLAFFVLLFMPTPMTSY
jgi:membrane-associated protease RseP (regulator of RpoE activity)